MKFGARKLNIYLQSYWSAIINSVLPFSQDYIFVHAVYLMHRRFKACL